jgi:3-deoxy-manno-octulosonate cytidylyltransferase (CMP-KDO synthetase)
VIIIPARLGSTRFPNKILADINGLPMVIKTAKAVEDIDEVLIATDSEYVVEICKSYGFNAVMTSTNHQSGTDRIYEAANTINLNDNDIVINIQADEPFIEKSVVKAVYDLTKLNANLDSIIMNSCYKIVDSHEADNPNIVKVVTSLNEKALYFSRSKIPYSRDHHLNEYKGHLGIYGFTMKSLRTFCSLPHAPLENIEKLEQLRALYSDYEIGMVVVETESFGIDTIEDLEKALKEHKV